MDSQEVVQQRSGNKKRRVILSNDVGLSQVLEVITDSNLLTTEELGRLLLFVSKRMTASAFREREDVWKCLCFSHWGKDDANSDANSDVNSDGNSNANMLMTITGLAAEECFRKLAVDNERFEVPRPLRYSPEDYLIIVSVHEVSVSHRFKNKPIFCKAIPGQDMPDFFEEGLVCVELDKSHWKCVVDKEVEDFHVFLDWEAKVHLMRLPDRRIIPIVKTETWESIYPLPDPRVASGSEECYVEFEGVEPDPPRLEMNTSYGLALKKRYFRYDNRFEEEVFFNRFEMEISMGLDYRMTSTCQTNDSITISGFQLYPEFIGWYESREMDPERRTVSEMVEGTDVTFAHVLEALDARGA